MKTPLGQKVIKRTQQSVETLQRKADKLITDEYYDSALALLCAVLVIDPSRVAAIHKIGKCLEATGAEDDAKLCYRGALPDFITEKYLDSKKTAGKIRSYAECADVRLLHGFDEEQIAIDPPVRNDVNKSYGQFSYKETYAREAFCTIAEQGGVWFDGLNIVALDKHRHIIQEQTKGSALTSYHAIQSANAVELQGTACFLDGRSSAIYYHWMLDILPKIGVLQSSGISLDEIDYFIVSAKSRFQLETLRACGIREEQLVFSKGNTLYQADRMIIPNLKNDQGEKVYHGLGVGLSSRVPGFLQELFDVSQPSTGEGGTEGLRVYISRSTRGSRNIANEPQLIKALEERGFTTVEFERLTVAEQAKLMARAEVVVGVHGAGFTNLSFCRPGTRVIEIFGDYVVPCYWALCAVAKLDYAQFMASSVAAVDTADNPGERVIQLRDLEIDVNAVEFIGFLDETLGSERAATVAA